MKVILKKSASLILAVCCIAGCKPKKSDLANNALYFDIKGYFEQEAIRLNSQHRGVTKTISINGIPESKKLIVIDFKKELSAFIDADINKLSWKGAFNVEKNDSLTIYRTADQKIPVKSVEIYEVAHQIKAIRILRANSNMLYKTADTLLYQKDKGYEIKKMQDVKLLSPAYYSIVGRFN